MKTLRNYSDIIMMIWETNPKKRNKYNKIKAYVKPNVQVNKGDFIQGNDINYKYEIMEVLGRRKSAHSEYDYIYLDTKNKPV